MSRPASASVHNASLPTAHAVPLGTDSKRSYSEFMGFETKEEAEQSRIEAHGHYVELPYYAVKMGLRF